MAAGLNGLALLNEALEMLKKEGATVWGYVIDPVNDEANVFSTHKLTDEVIVQSTTSVLEVTYPAYFKLFTGEVNGTAN